MSGHTHTHTHTYTHDNYYNPRCAHAHRGLIRIMGYKDLNLLSVFLEPSPIHSLETDLVLAVKPQYQRMLHI